MMLLDWVLCEEDQEANLIIEQTLREHRETTAPFVRRRVTVKWTVDSERWTGLLTVHCPPSTN